MSLSHSSALPLFEEPHARNSDPQTSHDAAASVNLTNLGRTKDAIIAALYIKPMTDEQIAAHFAKYVPFKVSPSGLRTRRSWLVQHGLVKALSEDGKTASGRACTVWSLK